MVNLQRRRCALARTQGALLQHGVHVLAVEHVVVVAPSLLVVAEVVDAVWVSGVPVAADEALEQHGVSHLDVDSPLLQPARAVGGARDGGTDLAGKVIALVDGDLVAGPAESSGNAHASDTTANDGDVQFPPPGRCCNVRTHDDDYAVVCAELKLSYGQGLVGLVCYS